MLGEKLIADVLLIVFLPWYLKADTAVDLSFVISWLFGNIVRTIWGEDPAHPAMADPASAGLCGAIYDPRS